ncbi:helix-turn-helix domain-containing protein [Stakelama tenebrarum]|uniref:Helix-turn-helix domain-containing protein n=1 Tax=Stakelama tenebrarum TaxID=2711215 RepID=A0A6G6Y173_9SPHN|nr:helix-turn-helix domain-containing protein [Sphingosinithalassobacter tenebrarum]QIG78468.1 helix-turn-helix domain-containing protein [Sphingosinithalassobacter tenebrarum]
MDGEAADNPSLFPTSVGEKLRDARLAQGLQLTDIAARTRIPQRHLESIEASDYSTMPSPTYALGFAKSYARAVGADEVAIARQLRGELGSVYDREPSPPPYEMDDPTRTPPSGLVIGGVVIALLLAVAVVIVYTTGIFRGSPPPAQEELVLPEDESPAPIASPSTTPIPTGGQVTLTATDTVWLRVTDGEGNRLFEKEMAAGESYDVPTDADGPQIKTGRADQLRVTINGSDAGVLGPGEQTVEMGLTPEALRDRPNG